MLCDLRPKKLTGKVAEAALQKAHITTNKNMIPGDPEKPFVTSGLRLGTPALTTRGMGPGEMKHIARLIVRVLDHAADEAEIGARARGSPRPGEVVSPLREEARLKHPASARLLRP